MDPDEGVVLEDLDDMTDEEKEVVEERIQRLLKVSLLVAASFNSAI